MNPLLIGFVVLVVATVALYAFLRANPAVLAGNTRKVGGGLLGGLGLLLLARGQVQFAVMLLAIAAPLLLGRTSIFGPAPKASGQVSRVRTAYLDMSLDHDSGELTGRVIAGRFEGRNLAVFSLPDLLALHDECRDDQKTTTVLEAYLDRCYPDWRQTGAAASGAVTSGHTMTPGEARQVLGVGPQDDAEAIQTAWRNAMKRNHPDHGGSAYLAAKINEARRVLLGE